MNPLRHLAGPSEAQREYFRLDARASDLLDDLTRTGDPDDRTRILTRLAHVCAAMADVHDDAFGRHDMPDDAAGDLAQSDRFSSTVYSLLADVEAAVAYPESARNYTDSSLGQVAGPVLDRMVAQPDAVARAEMARTELCDALVDVIGGQAAEALATLPSPGHATRTLPQIARAAWRAWRQS